MYSHAGGGSGGYLEHVIKHAATQLFGFNLESVAYKTLRLEVKNIITARKRSFKEEICRNSNLGFYLEIAMRAMINSATGGTLVHKIYFWIAETRIFRKLQ